jgi:hypothetical protein
MDSLQWLWIAGAALAGAAVGVAVCHWQMNRTVELLRQRIERAEQARNGAIERSAQAREQIAQLNQAIAAMRRTHSARAATQLAAPGTDAHVPRRRSPMRDPTTRRWCWRGRSCRKPSATPRYSRAASPDALRTDVLK